MTLPSFLHSSTLDEVLSGGSSKKKQFADEVISDFWLALVSRELSLQGRREVLTGKAKFGIFGDGKELVQIAMAKAYKKGDHRAGYYRDQTFMMALGISTPEQFLAQLYSDPINDPFSGGRQMAGHFATPFIDGEGNWTDHISMYNTSSGISSTGGQMARAFGLAFASKKYRELNLGKSHSQFSDNGNEICICSIGDASTSEGVFWEALNAAAVEKVPLVVAVYDDGYGISVPVERQTVKGSISRALEGFLRDENGDGIDLYTVKGYDYQDLCITFEKAVKRARKKHRPAVVHVQDLTQQLGHSTSGSHERYKSKERLKWEKDFDCNRQMKHWLVRNKLLTEEQIEKMEKDARMFITSKRKEAWQSFQSRNETSRKELIDIYESVADTYQELLAEDLSELKNLVLPSREEMIQFARRSTYKLHAQEIEIPVEIIDYIKTYTEALKEEFGSYEFADRDHSPLHVPVIHPTYDEEETLLPGYQVINSFFHKAFEEHDDLLAFGEDVGKIGDVNQGMVGLQEKYGEARVFDTGIREWTIMGQGAGLAMRGLRAISEIQYLDYLVYALPFLTDDVATLRYRSAGLQQVPMIIRTRGHRLEGIWHTGSPLGMMINSLRGIHIAVPRNMVQAAGMYNTLLQGKDPGIVIECLNGYRLKESLPSNIGEYTVPLGIPEVLVEGDHITVVTYGSCVRYAMAAIKICADFGISAELIDIQTLLPFDMEKIIVNSLRKTNKILFLDEDVPGGASAYMMQQVLEVHGGFQHLDGPPATLTAKDHRTPYGNEGDYYAKPQIDDIVEKIYEIVFEQELS